jgi:hypothetical protein
MRSHARGAFAAVVTVCALALVSVTPALAAHSNTRRCGTVTVDGAKITVHATGRMSCKRARRLAALSVRSVLPGG